MALSEAFTWGAGGARMTPEAIAAQRKVAEALIERGSDYSPIQSPWQGVARVAQAMKGGFDNYRADAADKANRAEDKAMLQALLGGETPGIAPANPSPALPGGMPPIAPMSSGATVPAGPTQTADTPDFGKAIASIESGGRYDLLGPVTRTGDRAHGKYQVMGANVGPWTREVLGREMSPQEFLRDPDAQEAVFKGKFGQYAQKYGPEGAAKAWFAGEGGMNDPNRRDILGTTVAAYANKFNRVLGPQTAALAPVAPDTEPSPQAPAAAGPQMAQVAPGMTAAPAIAPAPAPAASGGLQGVSPGIIGAMTSPYVSESTKKIATILLQQKLQQDGVTTVDLGNAVGVMDKRGNIVRQIPKGEPNKGPEFGEIGTDPATGEKIMGWRDPRSQTVTPYKPQGAAPATPSEIPPAPPGVDPKVWRETHSKSKAEGSLPPKFDDVAQVRKEVQALPSYKNHAQAAPIYKTMLDAAGRNTRASDLNLVYGLGKIFDPGSVVREGEMVMVKNTAGLPDWLVGAINSLNGGAALTEDTRKAVMAEAYSRMKSYEDVFDYDTEHYRGIATRSRMNVDDVIAPLRRVQPWAPPEKPAATPAAAPAAPARPGGRTRSGLQWSVE